MGVCDPGLHTAAQLPMPTRAVAPRLALSVHPDGELPPLSSPAAASPAMLSIAPATLVPQDVYAFALLVHVISFGLDAARPDMVSRLVAVHLS